MLRRWLKQGSEFEPCRRRVSSRCPSVSHSRSPSVDIKSSGDDHSDATSGEGGLVNPALLLGLIPRTSYQLKDKAVEYCLRIIDQCERSERTSRGCTANKFCCVYNCYIFRAY